MAAPALPVKLRASSTEGAERYRFIPQAPLFRTERLAKLLGVVPYQEIETPHAALLRD